MSPGGNVCETMQGQIQKDFWYMRSFQVCIKQGKWDITIKSNMHLYKAILLINCHLTNSSKPIGQ